MFERGIVGHTTPALSQPLIQTSLLIFEPGRTKREDVYVPTSAVDILPTLLHVNRGEIPEWSEGNVVPPFSAESSLENRSLYSMDIRGNGKRASIAKGSLVHIREPLKLTYYFGLKDLDPVGGELIELHDLEKDPQEMHDLYPDNKVLASQLLDELKSKLDEADRAVS